MHGQLDFVDVNGSVNGWKEYSNVYKNRGDCDKTLVDYFPD